MEEAQISQAEIRKAEQFLKGYQINRKFVRVDRYERSYMGYRELPEELPGEIALARARMFEVRHFIMGLPNNDEKLLLYYHYVRGESIEKCAELLGISRASGFRMKKRALREAALHDRQTENTWNFDGMFGEEGTLLALQAKKEN